jgi:hypothetical protein
MKLFEGGNAIEESSSVNKEDVAQVVALAKKALPKPLITGLQTDIGSAGYKLQSGDIDLMVEASDVVELFNTGSAKDPIKTAKQLLGKYFTDKGIHAVLNGRNVSIGIQYKTHASGQERVAQVDVMCIQDASIVAPWHQHGLRDMYNKETEFKGQSIFILMNSIGKALNLKFDAFGAKLMKRDTNEIVARTRDEVAKILLSPTSTSDDLNSIKTIMKALSNDPMRDAKLAQAREDSAKGIITLPESYIPGSTSWFRTLSNIVSSK